MPFIRRRDLTLRALEVFRIRHYQRRQDMQRRAMLHLLASCEKERCWTLTALIALIALFALIALVALIALLALHFISVVSVNSLNSAASANSAIYIALALLAL